MAPSRELLAEKLAEFDAQAAHNGPPKPVFKAMSDVYEAGRRAGLWKGPKFCTCNPSRWRDFSSHVHKIIA